MRIEIAEILTNRFKGRKLIKVERREFDWAFDFERGCALGVSCPWRVLVDGGIAFTFSDDGQKFGWPEPLDGEGRVRDIVGTKTISAISLREGTGDLSIRFGDDVVLEALNMSSGYEGWQINAPGLNIIGVGGGEVTIYLDGNK